MESGKIQEIETVLPTYLKDFVSEEKILLIFKKLLNLPSDIGQQIQEKKIVEDTTSENTLDLTGSPLKVNLDGDETLVSFQKKRIYHAWADEEASQYPLTLYEARKHIANYLKDEETMPIYVICDGNQNNIITLGAQITVHNSKKYTTTSMLKTLGYLSKDHEDLSFESMEKSHLLRCGIQQSAINYLVKSKHYLYGSYLKTMDNAFEAEYFGNICLEKTCQNKCTIDTPQSASSNKLILQVAAGHRQSPVNFLWQELCILQSYLNIFSSEEKCSDGDTVVCSNPISQMEIHQSIKELVFHLKFWRMTKQEIKIEFDLNNIRDENIIDKLWNILKYSATLSDLTENFYILFQELSGITSIPLITKNDTTDIGVILNKIVGKGQIPTVSFNTALRFLFELGIEKMKDDYQHIINFFYGLSRESINNQWCKLSSVGYDSAKLGYLGKLHIATEFIYLFKETGLSNQSFQYFCSKVCKNYVEANEMVHKFTEMQTSPLCEFSLVLNTLDTDDIGGLPVSWSIQMTTKKQDVEITTMYHLSQHPIFPPSIYSYNGMVEIEDKKISFHVTKFEKQQYFM